MPPIHIHNNPPKTSLPMTENQVRVLRLVPRPPDVFIQQDGSLNRTLRVLWREGMIRHPVDQNGEYERNQWERTDKGDRRLKEEPDENTTA